MTALSIAARHARRQVALARRAAREMARLWARVDRVSIARSWAGSLPAAVQVLGSAQAIAAASAGVYLDDLLDEYGVEPGAEGRLVAETFAGVASDGRDLASLLYQPAIVTLTAIKGGASDARALSAGRFALDTIVRSQVADAGRAADGVALAVRPQLAGYVRMVVGGTCARCLILAGRFYRWNAGFQRHPRCFPAGTVVSGPGADGATRRWYQGELVVIRTASGKNLAVTGNHPILTSQGWLPANLLREGGNVVSRASGDRSGSVLVPDHDQVPARIQDLWRADGMRSLGRVPVSAEDFHGDGLGSSHVDVVLADRLLGDWEQVATFKELGEEQFALGPELAVTLAGAGAGAKLVVGDLALPGGALGGCGLGGSLGLGHLAGTDQPGLAWSADGYAGVHEALADHAAADPELLPEGVLALASEVRGHDRGAVDVAVTPRWDAPSDPFSVESRVAYASRGDDLRFRLAGKVEIDRVVEVRRVEWSGHVYNLTSREGWYDANGMIVSNCDCRHIPAPEDAAGDLRTDPKAAFEAMDAAEQDRVFGATGAQAIRDGADMARVVNARRGMQVAGGRQFTTEAAGRRPRLMPEQIYRDARDREDAVRLLRLHRYIT